MNPFAGAVRVCVTSAMFFPFVADTLLSSRSLGRGIFKQSSLHEMLEQQGVGSRRVWGALSLEIWFQTFVDA